jgi:hypothetical protein
MSERPPPVEQHVAVERAGKHALHAAHGITAALAENGDGGEEPVVLRRHGPHRSIAGLARLIDEALADEAPTDEAPTDGPPEVPSAR